jgi:hypothetical protein
MEKSIVGDPLLWPGLIYTPLNRAGLIFALGTVASSIGLLFEEFSDNFDTAICRRRTDHGWERLKIAFTLQSSEFQNPSRDIDLLICWLDDVPDTSGSPRLELSRIKPVSRPAGSAADGQIKSLESILPEEAARDLLERGHTRESFEETVRQFDEQIKKLRGK